MKSCGLNGDDATRFIVEKLGDNFAIRLDLGTCAVSVEIGDPYGVELFLEDLSACAISVGNMEHRLSKTVRTGDSSDSFYNDIDTPFYIDFAPLDIMVFFKPRSSDGLPVTFNASVLASDWITIRTTKERFALFGRQLQELIGDRL